MSVSNSKYQAVIDGLRTKNANLIAENAHLKDENKRLRGETKDGLRMRRCVNCARNLPDGPELFPGYLDDGSTDCIYCRVS
jgi:hypothetical protein